jgi:hypothetical protein
VAVAPAASPIAVRELSPSVSWIVPPRAAAVPDDEVQQRQQQQ